MVDATPCLGGMITFFAFGHMVDATHCDVGGCVYMVDATPCLGWGGVG